MSEDLLKQYNPEFIGHNKTLADVIDAEGHEHLSPEELATRANQAAFYTEDYDLAIIACNECREKLKEQLRITATTLSFQEYLKNERIAFGDPNPEDPVFNDSDEQLMAGEVMAMEDALDQDQLRYKRGKFLALKLGIDLSKKMQIAQMIQTLRKEVRTCMRKMNKEEGILHHSHGTELWKEHSNKQALEIFLYQCTQGKVIGDEGFTNAHKFEK